MVPMDRPAVALQMVRELISDKIGGTGTHKQNLGTSDIETCGSAIDPGKEIDIGEPCDGVVVNDSSYVIWFGVVVIIACIGLIMFQKRKIVQAQGKYVRVNTGEVGAMGGDGNIELS